MILTSPIFLANFTFANSLCLAPERVQFRLGRVEVLLQTVNLVLLRHQRVLN